MISGLYKFAEKWSENKGVYIISDSHLEDSDCHLMDPAWPSPQVYIKKLKSIVSGHTLIHLGDVGNPEWFNQIKCYKILISGNHEKGKSYYTPYFDEVYEGPLFISDRILLSHEPIEGLPWCINIHGHDHSDRSHSPYHINLAANIVNYQIFNLGKEIRKGILSPIRTIHRYTIDEAIKKKERQTYAYFYNS